MWVTRSVEHLHLQGDLFVCLAHEAVEVTAAAQGTVFGDSTGRKAAMELSTSQKNIPSRALSTLSSAKESQVDEHLVGVHHDYC